MTDTSEDRIDLSPLEPAHRHRAERLTARVMSRISSEATAQLPIAAQVRWQLARCAIPAMLAAAAALAMAVVSSRPEEREPEPFAVAVMGRGPVTRWVALGRKPELPELVALAGAIR